MLESQEEKFLKCLKTGDFETLQIGFKMITKMNKNYKKRGNGKCGKLYVQLRQ